MLSIVGEWELRLHSESHAYVLSCMILVYTYTATPIYTLYHALYTYIHTLYNYVHLLVLYTCLGSVDNSLNNNNQNFALLIF